VLSAVNENIVTDTKWLPVVEGNNALRYREIAEALRRDILSQVLPAGARLPPLRNLAYELGVTVGTVRHAFDLVAREGLIERHVGRGTFVGGGGAQIPGVAPIGQRPLLDFAVNRPPRLKDDGFLRTSLDAILSRQPAWDLLDYRDYHAFEPQRAAVAKWAMRNGVSADAENVVLTVGGSDALAICLAFLTKPGDRIFLEAYTYSGVKNLCRIFGVEPVPIAMDEGGLDPDALADQCSRGRAKVLLCMPRVHNPTTRKLSSDRRARILDLMDRYGLTLVEDDVYGPNPDRNDAPISALRPNQSYYVGSLSKSLAPGLRIGFIVAPKSSTGALSAIGQSLSWMVSPLMAELAMEWIRTGLADRIADEHRAEILARQRLLSKVFVGLNYETDRFNTHVWLSLPDQWSARDFVDEAERRGVAVVPGDHFAVSRTVRGRNVRVALCGARDHNELKQGLEILSDICLVQQWPPVY
jgi:DNA-binding transcriptional MocR family regulator